MIASHEAHRIIFPPPPSPYSTSLHRDRLGPPAVEFWAIVKKLIALEVGHPTTHVRKNSFPSKCLQRNRKQETRSRNQNSIISVCCRAFLQARSLFSVFMSWNTTCYPRLYPDLGMAAPPFPLHTSPFTHHPPPVAAFKCSSATWVLREAGSITFTRLP